MRTIVLILLLFISTIAQAQQRTGCCTGADPKLDGLSHQIVQEFKRNWKSPMETSEEVYIILTWLDSKHRGEKATDFDQCQGQSFDKTSSAERLKVLLTPKLRDLLLEKIHLTPRPATEAEDALNTKLNNILLNDDYK